ncbi:protein SLC31A2 [Scleropages formosus]|uniref:Copper transport protein n=1 Tax=Scleropages formosus TaxID=113540 RepID=A0A8C9TLJ0_SCLFO|nr:probable low affinity copper uptake protein 2 [Scleropages formosus]
MMPMHFVDSSSVTLLFDFWDVHGPAGMVLSVFVVLLLTVIYELLKVGKVWLSERQLPTQPIAESLGSNTTLASNPSEMSLATTEPQRTLVNKWLLHCLQTAVHVVQVALGYMLMLCVMSYNVWIFLGVILGSVIGYFLAFPLVGRYS